MIKKAIKKSVHNCCGGFQRCFCHITNIDSQEHYEMFKEQGFFLKKKNLKKLLYVSTV